VTQKRLFIILAGKKKNMLGWWIFPSTSPCGRWAKKFISDPHSTHEHGTAAKNTRTRAWHSGQKHTYTSMARRPKTQAHEHGTAAKNTL